MKKLIPLLAITFILSACARGQYPHAPAVPADIPPPTNLLGDQPSEPTIDLLLLLKQEDSYCV